MKRFSGLFTRNTPAVTRAKRVDSNVDPVWDDEAALSWTKDYQGGGQKCRQYLS